MPMYPALTDEEMIRQYLPGQPNQCLEILYNRYVDKVYRQCLSITQDSEQAQDFTHDIFIKVFGKLDAFGHRSSFSTWLYSVAYNYCADQTRLARRLPTTGLDEHVEQVSELGEEVMHEDIMHFVQQALERLPLEEQTLLRRKYAEGLRIEELAQLYRVTTSAIKMRLKRSKARLQRYYA